MRHTILILAVTVAGLACRAETSKSPEGGAPPPAAASAAPGSAGAAAPGALPDPRCGRHSNDWCAAPAGDPCGAHKTVDACRADPACTGMKYRGEGPECKTDERGFGIGCPTVGCISR
ncbi:MAG TPA: hypothetical protein VFE68_07875 [Vicinamibacteria bacterium]|nr:hypothetical protein [Vicinamibacteria bacterium]